MNASPKSDWRLAEDDHRITISRHAYRRARQRLHWSGETILRMADRAYKFGFSHENSNGILRFHLHMKSEHDAASRPVLYGENIYVFTYKPRMSVVVLLTIYRADHSLLRVLANKSKRCGTNTHFGVN